MWTKPHRRKCTIHLSRYCHSHSAFSFHLLSCVYIKYIPVIPINAKTKTEIKSSSAPFHLREIAVSNLWLWTLLLPSPHLRCRNKDRAQLTCAAGGNLCLVCDAQMNVQRVPLTWAMSLSPKTVTRQTCYLLPFLPHYLQCHIKQHHPHRWPETKIISLLKWVFLL